MEPGPDRLSLAYNTFFSDSRAIQLLLRPGELLGDRQDEDHAWTRSRGTETRGGRQPHPALGLESPVRLTVPARVACLPLQSVRGCPQDLAGFHGRQC